LKTDEELARDAVVVENVPGQRLRAYEANLFPPVGQVRAVQLKGISLEREGNRGTIDAVEFDINTWAQLTLAFAYFHAEGEVPTNANDTADGSVTASAFAFLLRAFAVFEYDEKNGVDGFQANTADSINGVYDLSHRALQWKNLVANRSMVTDNSGREFKVWYISAETLDEVFFIRFIVCGTPLEVGGAHITPDSVKVDFAIRWFTNTHVPALWTPGPSSSTLHPTAQVGVASAMAALAVSAEARPATASANPSLTFGAAGFQGYFSWAPRADVVVNGVEAARVVSADVVETRDPDVVAAFRAGWVIRAMFFSFEGTRPSEVAWDPEFGSQIEYNSATTPIVNLFVVAFFALLVLFA
jgi:hypothetical protein